MSTSRSAERDERTLAVENASYTLGYFLLATALLYDGAYRSIVLHQSVWDLLALVFVSFAVCRVYQARQKALVPLWTKRAMLIAFVFGILGAIFGWVLSIIRST